MEVISIPPYPGGVSYEVQYSDPTGGDVNAPNPFGTWTALSGSPFSYTSNIIDQTTNTLFRLYRVRPTFQVQPGDGSPAVSVVGRWYDPFTPTTQLYDPQITGQLLPEFRSYIGDFGSAQTSSTDITQDTGAGTGLLQFDGETTIFNLADIPDAQPAICIEGLTKVVKNGLTLLNGTDYFVDYGAGSILFASPPASADGCNISFYQASYTNAWLNACLTAAIRSLPQLGISSYAVKSDNNANLLTAVILDDGLKPIIYQMALKILHRALITSKSREARAYKIGDFSMDTAPSRVIEAMSAQGNLDWTEMKSAANNYIRTATIPIAHTVWDAFLDMSGALPPYAIFFGMAGMGWEFWI